MKPAVAARSISAVDIDSRTNPPVSATSGNGVSTVGRLSNDSRANDRQSCRSRNRFAITRAPRNSG